MRFNRQARELLASAENPSLREWLAQRGFSRSFIERLIVPQVSAVWSADTTQMWSFPARFMLEFFDNHGMLGYRGRPAWRTITGGSRSYVLCVNTSSARPGAHRRVRSACSRSYAHSGCASTR